MKGTQAFTGYDFKFPVAQRLTQSQRQRRQPGKSYKVPRPWGVVWGFDVWTHINSPLWTVWSEGRDPTQTQSPHLCNRTNKRTQLPRVSVKMRGDHMYLYRHPLSQYLLTASAKENRGADGWQPLGPWRGHRATETASQKQPDLQAFHRVREQPS